MMKQRAIPPKKLEYSNRLLSLMREYEKILVIGVDNVGSSHFQRIRTELRGDAVILMGKNTVVRKILRQNEKEFPDHAQMIPKLFGNLGFVFTNGDVSSIRSRLLENKVGAAARVGAIAPCDVNLFPGPTGLEPGQTAFLQRCNIATMISRGQIEIRNSVELIKKGGKVTPSQAEVLTKLNLRPFKYGLSVSHVYDEGAFFSAKVLDLSEDDLLQTFALCVKSIACVSLEMGYPTLASVPHSLSNAHKNIFFLSLAMSYPYKSTEKIIHLLQDPDALQEALAAVVAASEVKEVEVLRCNYQSGDDPVDDVDDGFGPGGLFEFSDEEF